MIRKQDMVSKGATSGRAPGLILALCAASLLTACATEFSVPVTGFIGSDQALGQTTARLDGNGTFSVSTLSGLTCQGTYDSLDSNPSITAPASCSDGRSGTLLIARNTMTGGGTVIGRLNDGTDARFVFGNLTFNQAFGGTASQTNPYPGTN
jgi:hypothetical protein